jgi:hypothetical protein
MPAQCKREGRRGGYVTLLGQQVLQRLRPRGPLGYITVLRQRFESMHARFSPHFTFVAKLEGENGQAGGLPVLGCDIGVLG